MWHILGRPSTLGIGLATLFICLLGAFHTCKEGSCLALQTGQVFRTDGPTLYKWVNEDAKFSAKELKESCDRKVESSARDHATIQRIELQANSGPTLNEVSDDPSEEELNGFAPLLEALNALDQAAANLTAYLNSSQYSGISPASSQGVVRRHLPSKLRRGIVIAAGGLLPLSNIYSTLYVLRHVHKSKVPVEIYYNGIDEFNLETQQAFTTDFADVSCHDISKAYIPSHLQPPAQSDKLFRQQIGFTLKAKMLLITKFEEVLVLDSDSIPLADPEKLFESPEFKVSGNLFWPDFWAKDRHCPGPVYRFLNLTDPWEVNPSELTVESGQFFVNRRMHHDVIQYMVMLNMYGEYTYRLMAGDKDTYRLAFSLAGKADEFLQIKAPPADALRGPADFQKPVKCEDVFPDLNITESPTPHLNAPSEEKLQEHLKKADAYKHAGMIQMTPQGQMVFLHHTADSKWDPRQAYAYYTRPISFVTFPLNPELAAKVFLDGFMYKDKFNIKNTTSCPSRPGLQLLDTIDRCRLNKGGQDSSRVPMLPAHLFPELTHTIEEAFRVFKDWQVSFFKDTNPLSAAFTTTETKDS